jgi:hypothetical protein
MALKQDSASSDRRSLMEGSWVLGVLFGAPAAGGAAGFAYAWCVGLAAPFIHGPITSAAWWQSCLSSMGCAFGGAVGGLLVGALIVSLVVRR